MPAKPNPAQQAIRCRRCALRCTTIPQRASALHTAQSTPAPQSTSAPRPADPLSARKSGPRPRRDPLPTRKTSASAWLSEPSPAAACSFNACLLLDQLAVVHLVGGTVDDDVPAVRHAGIRGVQVALRAVELAGLVGLMQFPQATTPCWLQSCGLNSRSTVAAVRSSTVLMPSWQPLFRQKMAECGNDLEESPRLC